MLPDVASLEKLKDPVESAEVVGLNYVTDDSPGISRERCGNGFRYRGATGNIVTDRNTLARIKSLVIPPAWTEVWICPDPKGHLQATGRDDRRRKQFRYHRRWREIRDETKYAHMIAFASALPRIRQRVEQDLALPDLPRNKVLATVVRLLEESHIRVGNEEYARENESFGLTTLRDKHVDVKGSTVRFHFRGKSGKSHTVDVNDRRLARIVKNCQDIPGQELFQFIDDEGERHSIRSDDVNQYLREVSGEDYTAKDFRTWAGTVLAAGALMGLERFHTKAEAKKNVVAAIASVASRLGNTPAVCRKCYIHPHILDSYLGGTLLESLDRSGLSSRRKSRTGLQAEERMVLKFLKRRLTMEQQLARAIKKEKRARSRFRRPAFRLRSGRRK
jgi:DNA topoisomerase-1